MVTTNFEQIISFNNDSGTVNIIEDKNFSRKILVNNNLLCTIENNSKYTFLNDTKIKDTFVIIKNSSISITNSTYIEFNGYLKTTNTYFNEITKLKLPINFNINNKNLDKSDCAYPLKIGSIPIKFEPSDEKGGPYFIISNIKIDLSKGKQNFNATSTDYNINGTVEFYNSIIKLNSTISYNNNEISGDLVIWTTHTNNI